MARIISVIIPVLNEEAIIVDCLGWLASVPGAFELIVVDGESVDSTRRIVAESLVNFKSGKLVSSNRGRGPQLNAGAAAASGDILLFVHADTKLPREAIKRITEAAEDDRIVGGNFSLGFGNGRLVNRAFSLLDRLRRWFGIYYGDSAIWAKRAVFEELKGFRDWPLMEDFDFCRRLERAGRTLRLSDHVISSDRRWRGQAMRTILVWVVIQWLYLIGFAPSRLARLYYDRATRTSI